MNDVVRGLVLGGLLLLLGWLAMRLVRSMACKQTIGAWTVTSALVCWAGCWLPVWLPVLPQPDFATKLEPTIEKAQRPQEAIPMMWEFQPDLPVVRLALPDMELPEFAPVEAQKDLEVELPAAPVPAAPVWSWSATMTLLVLLIPAGLLGLLAVAQLALARLVWKSRPVAGRAWNVWRGLTSHLAKPPRLLTNDRLASPVCFGWWKPTIVLPTRLAEQATTSKLTWIYRHELDHLERGDHRTAAVLGLAQVVFFALPWFWLLRRDLLRAQEHLADAAAIGSSTKEATDYAEFLVDLSEQTINHRPLAALSVRATPSELFRRVNMLLSNPEQRPASRTISRWLGGALLSTAVALSGLGFASAQVPVAPPPLPPAPGEGAPPAAPLPPAAPALPFAPPAPAAPVEDKKLKELQSKLEKLVLDGKTDEAKKVVDEITKLKEKIAERPVAPLVAPLLPPAMPRPPVAMRGDFIAPPMMEAPVSKVRKQYDEQIKSFDDLIEKAKDADAKDALKKARDEYVRQMADTMKEEDAKTHQNRLFQSKPFAIAPPQAIELNDDLARVFQQQQKMMDELFKNRGQQPFVLQGELMNPLAQQLASPRFGVQTAKVPDALIEQLDLARDTGLLVQDVIAGSIAEKSGVKKNDVLLKFAGKDVPTDTTSFSALVNKQKAGEKFDVVVLRKSKEVKIEGVTLPELKKVAREGRPWQSMQIQIQNDDVTIDATADGMNYKLSGPMVEGTFTPDSIVVGEKKYDSLDKVPEADQAPVKALINRVGRSK